MKTILPLTVALGTAAVVIAQVALDQPKKSSGVVQVADVKWGALNPARGKKGPRAADLWGDRTGNGSTGFLVKFTDGFSSPPHIHNVSYRGVVISGLVHNDDPKAEEMWMPAGSFWTQPAGEVHITSAKGEDVTVYVEIDQGPYLVMPPEEASDNGERPVNMHASNLVWLNASDTSWLSAEGAQLAFLWGESKAGKPGGVMLKLPAGFEGEIRSSSDLQAVVVAGQPEVGFKKEKLQPGSSFQSEGVAIQSIRSKSDQESILYLRSDQPLQVVSMKGSN